MFERIASPIGIEAIAVHVPAHYLELTALAQANAVDPAKYLKGLGGRRFAVPAPGEDPVTLGFEAARGLLDRYGVDPTTIGLLVVGTESGVDGAKPIAAYLHGLLGLPTVCRTFDTKHACYSGTAALRMAADWCAMRGRGSGRKALVVATDIARYSVGSPGEPTQGAGAVAMLISHEPACFALDPHPEAVYSEQVMDFWRPHYRSAAVVDGQTSISAYLRALLHTWCEYERISGLGWDDYAQLLFHVPFPKLAFKGFSTLHERSGGKPADLSAAFARLTGRALWANQELGNCYSGSLYLSLAGLLERADEGVAGARVGLFSYGSGCCAEFFSGRVGANPAAWRDRIGIAPGLLRRQPLSYERYLAFRRTSEALACADSCVEELAAPCTGAGVRFCGIRGHQRVYTPPPVVARSYSARAQMGK